MTYFKMKVKDIWWKFKNSQFINHISFLWHWKNFFFLLKYPFYRVYNRWTGKFSGYAYTEYDSIPVGWRIAFGKQLSEDIKKAGKESRKRLGKHLSWKKLIMFEQIKEKWGELCLYASATSEIDKVLEKYEMLSAYYCISCGKPARYRTSGWITYLCKDCYINDLKILDKYNEKPITDEEIEQYLKKAKIKDWPTYHEYINGKEVEIDLLERYGIDVKKLTQD